MYFNYFITKLLCFIGTYYHSCATLLFHHKKQHLFVLQHERIYEQYLKKNCLFEKVRMSFQVLSGNYPMFIVLCSIFYHQQYIQIFSVNPVTFTEVCNVILPTNKIRFFTMTVLHSLGNDMVYNALKVSNDVISNQTGKVHKR